MQQFCLLCATLAVQQAHSFVVPARILQHGLMGRNARKQQQEQLPRHQVQRQQKQQQQPARRARQALACLKAAAASAAPSDVVQGIQLPPQHEAEGYAKVLLDLDSRLMQIAVADCWLSGLPQSGHVPIASTLSSKQAPQ